MRRRGSASLMLAVVTGACLVVFTILLQGARFREAESAHLRAVAAASDGVLSTYSGVLLQRYGLFAFPAEDGSAARRADEVFRACLPDAAAESPLTLRPRDSLADPAVLSDGIRRFVLERVPALVLARGLERWSCGSTGEAASSFDPLFDAGGQGGTSGSDWQAALLEALEKGDSAAGGSTRTPDDPGYGIADASKDLRDSLLAIAEANRGAAGDATAPALPSPLDPDALGAFLDRSFSSLPASVRSLVDSVVLDVYAASMFRSRVVDVVEDGVRRPCLDLRGRALSGLSTSRPCEVEFLIAGHPEDEENIASVERRILGLRLAFRLLAQTQDEEARARARALGETLSALLSAATSGSLSIPSGFLAGAIQVAWAYGEAKDDVRKLVEGQRVPLLPAALAKAVPELADWKAGYGDYLAVLLAATPDDVKLDRIATAIGEDIALFGAPSGIASGAAPLSGYFTSVRASTVYREEEIAFTASFGDVAP